MQELQLTDRGTVSRGGTVDRRRISARLFSNWAHPDATRLSRIRIGDDRFDLYRRRTHDPAERHHVPVIGHRVRRANDFPDSVYRELF